MNTEPGGMNKEAGIQYTYVKSSIRKITTQIYLTMFVFVFFIHTFVFVSVGVAVFDRVELL